MDRNTQLGSITKLRTVHDEELLAQRLWRSSLPWVIETSATWLIRLHRGLLHYSAADSFDEAYDLRESLRNAGPPSTR